MSIEAISDIETIISYDTMTITNTPSRSYRNLKLDLLLELLTKKSKNLTINAIQLFCNIISI